jgi:hypothetical protein
MNNAKKLLLVCHDPQSYAAKWCWSGKRWIQACMVSIWAYYTSQPNKTCVSNELSVLRLFKILHSDWNRQLAYEVDDAPTYIKAHFHYSVFIQQFPQAFYHVPYLEINEEKHKLVHTINRSPDRESNPRPLAYGNTTSIKGTTMLTTMPNPLLQK